MKIFKGGIFEWRKTVIAIMAVNVATAAFVFFNRFRIPDLIPLYYGNPAGAEQLGPRYGLLIPPFFVLVVLITSVLVTKAYKDSFIESLFAICLTILTILSTLTVLKIFILVGNI